MKCLVTGGAGFIGQNLVKELLRRGEEVWVIDDLSNGQFHDVPKGAVFKFGDVRVPRIDLDKEDFDMVFNLACRNILVSWVHPTTDLHVNAGGTLEMLRAFERTDVKFIQASSVSVETEQSPYAVSKSAAEKYCRLYREVKGKDVRVIRFSNVYGPGQKDGLIAKLVNQVRMNQPMVVYGDGTQTRDFVYVKDAVGATLELANYGLTGPVSVGTEIAVPIIEVAKLIQSKLGGEIEFQPLRLIDNVVHRKVEASFYNCQYQIEDGINEYLETLD